MNAVFGDLLIGHIWHRNGYAYAGSNIIKPRTGYWLYCGQTTTIDITGVLDTFAAKELQPGWNLVGVVNDQSTLQNARSTWTWNGNQFVIAHSLQRWKAYWIYLDKSGVLDP